MAEERERTIREWMRIILPRVLRATLWGFIMGGELLIPLLMPSVSRELEAFFPPGRMGIPHLVAIFVAFEVAIQLLDGTVFRYALSMARAIVSMISVVIVTNGGVMTFTMTPPQNLQAAAGMVIRFTVNFEAILGVFLMLSLLSILKNMLQAVEFLAKKAEEPVTLPELP